MKFDIPVTDDVYDDDCQPLAMAIKKAFKGWKKPDAVQQELLRPTHDDELNDLHNLLASETWYTVSKNVLSLGYPAPGLLSDQAFTYFLPAFLLSALAGDCGEFVQELVDRIGPPVKKDIPLPLRLNISALNADQRSVLEDVLIFFKYLTFEFEPRTQRRIDRIVESIRCQAK